MRQHSKTFHLTFVNDAKIMFFSRLDHYSEQKKIAILVEQGLFY